MSEKQNIIVIGSGGGGVPLVQILQKKLDAAAYQLVVIEARDYYAHWPALIRASITSDGSIEETALIPNDRVFDSSIRVIRSAAKEINGQEVITESGETVPYNGVLALPNTRAEAIDQFRTFRKKLDAAQNVLIIGGGAIGVEYAGEIAHYAPGKKVTLIHSPKGLMNNVYSNKFRKALLDATTKLGVEAILGDRISPDVIPNNGFVRTEQGKRIQADLVIKAIGGTPNTGVVRAFDPSAVTSKGTVLVTPELRVKLASAKAMYRHAPLMAKNILAAVSGANPTLYPGMAEMILVTVGPQGGRGQLPWGFVPGDWVVKKLKSTDLFITPTRESLGYKIAKGWTFGSSKALLALGLIAAPVAYVLYNRLSVNA
ncbi:FAD/NAD(P)-binding domain-containing protein [Ceratobasidium sp. AG-I]|nr:FAD/NAD(P)-binding domain-containing protein [Ceratobasidium sp. AG-I]